MNAIVSLSPDMDLATMSADSESHDDDCVMDYGPEEDAFEEAPQPSEESVELLYTPAESIFAAVAPDLVANGWSVFPQQMDRRPGRVYNAPIKWSEDHDLKNRRPKKDVLDMWCGHCATLNAACVFGPASGNTFAIDIDVLDAESSHAIAMMAEECLGYTPLQREGRWPKIALIYRHAEGEEARVRSRRIPLEIPLPDPDDAENADRRAYLLARREVREVDGIEVQGFGCLLTFHGRHHKTGTYFKWLDLNPQLVGPEVAPLVTEEQVAEFLKRVHEAFGKPGSTVDRDNSIRLSAYGNQFLDGLVTPVYKLEDGVKLTDGRENLLRELAYRTVRHNPARIASADADGRDTLRTLEEALTSTVIGAFKDCAEMSGRWTERYLADQAKSKVRATVRALLSGRIKSNGTQELMRAMHNERAAETKAQYEKLEKQDLAEAKKREKRPPFTILGHDRGRFYILGRGGQVRDYSARDLATEATLLELDDIDYWFKTFPGKRGINTKLAANTLISEAFSVGIYDPDRLRGRGIHLDGDKIVAHLGDKLLVDGKEMLPSDYRGRYMYELARTLPIAVGHPPLTKEEAVGLVDVCNLLPIAEGKGPLLAGWVTIAPVCGAMTWRPHAWLCGEGGSGKSWTLSNIITPVLGSLALEVQGKTTEAGIRGRVRTDARPVIFDEAEGQNPADRARMQQVLDLARQASSESGPDIIKGTADGGSRSYRVRSCFVFSSINLGLTQAADESRCIVFEFRLGTDDATNNANFAKLCKTHAAAMGPDFGPRLLARTMKLIPVIRKSAEVFSAAIARTGKSRRLGDTLGVPLAGLWSLRSDDVVTSAEADDLIASSPWIRAATAAAEVTPEWRRAVDHLLQMTGREAKAGGLLDNVPLGTLICAAAGRHDEIRPTDVVTRVLADWGLRLNGSGRDATVYVSNTSARLSRIFEDTPWCGSWSTTISRADGAKKLPNPIRIGAVKPRVTEIPIGVFLD